MLKFCRQFFKQMKIIAHIQGNLTEDQAKAIIQTVEINLGCEKIEEVRWIFKVEVSITNFFEFSSKKQKNLSLENCQQAHTSFL